MYDFHFEKFLVEFSKKTSLLISLDVCPFCDPRKQLVYFGKRPTLHSLRALLKEGEGLAVRVDDLKLIRTMVEHVEFYQSRVADALKPPGDLRVLRQLIQAGKALEIQIDDMEVFPRLQREIWRFRAGEVLALKSVEKARELLKEGADFKGIEQEVERLNHLLTLESSLLWNTKVLTLLENTPKDVSCSSGNQFYYFFISLSH